MHGKILFKYGTMASGKSLRLIAEAHHFQEISTPFVIFKSSIDTRDGEGVVHSRALDTSMECINISTEDNVFEIMGKYIDARFVNGNIIPKWILVDEAQFLTAEQVDQLAAVADNFGINVMCYGLRTDFKTHLFEGSKRLFEVADSIEEIKTSCRCGSKTIFNARINSNKEIVTDGEQVEVGGDDKYISICRKCYYEKTGNPYYQEDKNNLD